MVHAEELDEVSRITGSTANFHHHDPEMKLQSCSAESHAAGSSTRRI